LKIAIIIASGYVLWRYTKNAFSARAQSQTPLGGLTVLLGPSGYCLSLYLNISGLKQGTVKTLLVAWKVREFFVTKRV